MKAVMLFLLAANFYCGYAQDVDSKELFNKCKDAVVKIDDRYGFGSGFLVSNDGWLITNLHVVKSGNTKYMKVTDFDGDVYEVVQIIKPSDPDLDLALLKISGYTKGHLLPISPSDLQVGDDVINIGHPRGFEWTLCKGVISNTDVRDYFNQKDHTFHFDAATNPGNSGGPIVNFLGQVVGVTTALRTDMNSTFIGIKNKEVRHFLEVNNIKYQTKELFPKLKKESERLLKELANDKKQFEEAREEFILKRSEFEKYRIDEIEKLKLMKLEIDKKVADSKELIAKAEAIRKEFAQEQESINEKIIENESLLRQLNKEQLKIGKREQKLNEKLHDRIMFELNSSIAYQTNEHYKNIDMLAADLLSSISFKYAFNENDEYDIDFDRVGLFYLKRYMLNIDKRSVLNDHQFVGLLYEIEQDFNFKFGSEFSTNGFEGDLYMGLSYLITDHPYSLSLIINYQCGRMTFNGPFSVGIAFGFSPSMIKF